MKRSALIRHLTSERRRLLDGDVKNNYTVILELGDDGWWAATCPEVPGTIGQGRTADEAESDLGTSIDFMLDTLRKDAEREMSPSAVRRPANFG